MTIPLESAPSLPPADDDADLFAWATVDMAPARPPRRDQIWRTIPGTSLSVWRNTDPAFAQAPATDPQLLLSFESAEPARLVPRRMSAFMNADIRSVLVGSFRQRAAAAYLARHGVHYLGDLALMSAFDVLTRLGPHASAFEDIKAAFLSLGLAMQVSAPWWTPPADYYARAR